MATATATLRVSWEWREVEPEGQVCAMCEEVAWLAPMGMFPLVSVGTKWVEATEGPVLVLCQACGEMAKELAS